MISQKKIRKSGSINIPISIRRDMCIQPNDAVDVQMKDGSIVITPVSPRCILCENTNDITKLFGKYICKNCATLVIDVLNEEGGAADE